MTADSVEWDTVQPMSMPALLDRVPIHDSYVKRLSIDSDSHLTVDIKIDRVWNRSLPEGFDTLMVRVDHPYAIRWIRGAIDVLGLCVMTAESLVVDAGARGALGAIDVLGLCVMTAESLVVDAGARGALLDDAAFKSYFMKSDCVVVHPAEDATLTRTRFAFLDEATLEILHGASVRAVVVNSDSRALDLSTIAGAST